MAQRHQTRPIEPGIGPRPNGQQDAAAWGELQEQVAATGRRTRATEAAAVRGAALADRPEQEQENEQGSSVEDRHEARRRTMADLRARLDRGREHRADILDRTTEGRPATPQADNGREDEGRTAAARREREEREHRQRDRRGRGGPER